METKTCENRGLCGLIGSPAPNAAVVTGFESVMEKMTLKARPLLPSVPSALQPCSQNIMAAPQAGKAAHGPVVKCSLPFCSHLAVSMIFAVLLCTREALTTRHTRFEGKKGHVSSYQESQLVYLFPSSRNGTQGLARLSKCSLVPTPCFFVCFCFFDRVSVAYGSLKLIILLLLSAECWDCRYALSHLPWFTSDFNLVPKLIFIKYAKIVL